MCRVQKDIFQDYSVKSMYVICSAGVVRVYCYVMLPWDVLILLAEFCPLKCRYVFSQTCKYFSSVDWSRFGIAYDLEPCNRADLRALILSEYSSRFKVVANGAVLWNCHLNSPLRVWTPWSSKWHEICPKMLIVFSHWHFVEYISDLGYKLKMKTPCIKMSYSHERVVRVFVPKSARIQSYLCVGSGSKSYREPRRRWQYLFTRKRTQKVRACLGFCVSASGSLRVEVKCFEFLG